MRVGSLFAGIGGFDLAARWMGWETAWFSEIDPYASAVLAHHWPGVPNHGDITRIDFTQVEPVEILCGGFPCQDVSNNGHQEGLDGERSGLWREYARAIGELAPRGLRWVVVENVSALLVRGFDRVLGDLAALGFDAEWHCIPAAAVGAPHRRDRLWLVAYPAGERGEGQRLSVRLWPEGPPLPDADRRGSGLADAARGRVARDGAARVEVAQAPGGDGLPRCDGAGGGAAHWETEPDVGRMVDGVSTGLDRFVWTNRLQSLGNAVVPEIPFVLFQAIEAAEAARTVTEAAA